MVNNKLKYDIPNDWEVRHLDDFGQIVSGGTPSTAVSEYWNGSIAWCTPTDITRTDGITISETEKYITDAGLKNSAAVVLPTGSLLLCTRATIGDSKIKKGFFGECWLKIHCQVALGIDMSGFRIPLQFYRYTKDGGKEKAVDHPLYFLLHDEPNPEMTSFVFRETLMTHLLLWGNAYSQIIRNARGEIIALYPLMPDRMTVNRDGDGCVEDSIADHSAYLLGAKNGNKLRYDRLKGCTVYKKAVQIIKDGGYATSLTYVEKLCSIIERWKLTQYDVAGEASDVVKYYRVRKNWEDAASQFGAYTVLSNAKAMADKHPGYEVYDWNGKQVYPEVTEGAASGMRNVDCPFMVKVSITDLNIRKGAGTNTAKTGACTGVGVFTIVEVKDGKGSDAGWGKLKSGAGWISLDYCQRV